MVAKTINPNTYNEFVRLTKNNSIISNILPPPGGKNAKMKHWQVKLAIDRQLTGLMDSANEMSKAIDVEGLTQLFKHARKEFKGEREYIQSQIDDVLNNLNTTIRVLGRCEILNKFKFGTNVREIKRILYKDSNGEMIELFDPKDSILIFEDGEYAEFHQHPITMDIYSKHIVFGKYFETRVLNTSNSFLFTLDENHPNIRK